MSETIVKETTFLWSSMVLGFWVTFVYDQLRVFRRILRHRDVWVSIEDIIFWVFCGWSMFAMLYRENYGEMRWFSVAGIIVGMLLCRKLVSARYISCMVVVFRKLAHLKKRLTHFTGMITIKLCKHIRGWYRRWKHLFAKKEVKK